VIERYKISILYTSPTAIRTPDALFGEEWPAKHDLSSLRLLGSVGEPINPEAWIWYRQNAGNGHLPSSITWWQTETGSILITPTLAIARKARQSRAAFPDYRGRCGGQRG